MRSRGLSQRAVGNALAVSNATVAGWCKGALPRPAVAKQLADYFGVTVEDLLDDRRDLPAAVPSPPMAMEESVSSSVHFATEMPSASTELLNPEHQAQLLATLQNLEHLISSQSQQLATQSQQIADLTAYLKSHGLHPPDPKGKGKG